MGGVMEINPEHLPLEDSLYSDAHNDLDQKNPQHIKDQRAEY